MRTTVTINDTILQSLKVRAAQTGLTVSELIESAVKEQLLEDLYDIEQADMRVNEPVESFEVLVNKLKEEGLI
jgi:phosphohistidine phosphatase SixA